MGAARIKTQKIVEIDEVLIYIYIYISYNYACGAMERYQIMEQISAQKKEQLLQTAFTHMDDMIRQLSRLDQAVTEDELEQMIPELLRGIGGYTQAERVYLFEWRQPEQDCFESTYVWHAEGAQPQIDELRRCPAKSGWISRLERGEAVVISDTEAEKEILPVAYELFRRQNIRSAIAFPVIAHRRLCGFISVDNPIELSPAALRLLNVIGDHLGSLRENLRMYRQMEQKNADLEQARGAAQMNNEVISAISKLYWRVYRLDLPTDTVEEIAADGEIHAEMKKTNRISQLFPRSCRETNAPEYIDRMLAFLDTKTLAERLRDRDTISQEYLTNRGNWHVGSFVVQKRDEKGDAVRLLYVIRIINEQKAQEIEYERRLAQSAEEAHRANMAKTDFLRRMSHDIRTPINAIRGMVEIANHYPRDFERLQDCRDKIWQASGYLLSLVNSVLDMNKLESGSVILEHKPFDLRKLLNEANTVARIQAAEYGLRYISDGDGAAVTHRYLIGSPTHLKQILLNFSSNAVKYNKFGGEIRVTCRETAFDGVRTELCFTCTDTGVGMSEEFQKHMFEPFVQERKNDARTRYNGSGLGLTIAKTLAEQMGGRIDFTSQEGVGTTFKLTMSFDVDPEPQAEETDGATPEYDFSGLHVLLAEDNELNQEIAQFLLEQSGISVTAVQNGREAVDAFEMSEPGGYDAIFMDIMMPVMNGLTAAQTIRALPRPDAKTVPIFAMTANAFADDVEKCIAAGMNEHFGKPLDSKKILQTISRYCGR